MAMMTATTQKINKAFYAHLYDEAGALTKLDGVIYFLSTDTGAITEIEPEHTPFLTVLGEIGLADTQQVMDRIHGGSAAVACGRAN